MGSLFACSDPKVDERVGVLTAAHGPRWVRSPVELYLLKLRNMVDNPTAPIPVSPADMVTLLGPLS